MMFKYKRNAISKFEFNLSKTNEINQLVLGQLCTICSHSFCLNESKGPYLAMLIIALLILDSSIIETSGEMESSIKMLKKEQTQIE